jgi:hypothetical protein
MTDRLAEIKKHVDGGDGLSLTREEIDWLIAEVERLRNGIEAIATDPIIDSYTETMLLNLVRGK